MSKEKREPDAFPFRCLDCGYVGDVTTFRRDEKDILHCPNPDCDSAFIEPVEGDDK